MATTGVMASTTVESTSVTTDVGFQERPPSEEGLYSGDELIPTGLQQGMQQAFVKEMPPTILAGKRPLQENQSDPDHSQSKKRRKQSKPVRISTLSNDSTDRNSEDGNNTEEDQENERFPERSTFCRKTCSYCSEIFDKEDRFKAHIQEEHADSLLRRENPSEEIQSESNEKSEKPLNLSGIRRTNSPSPVDITISSWTQSSQTRNDEIVYGTNQFLKFSPPNLSEAYNEGRLVIPGYIPFAPPFILPVMSHGHSSAQVSQHSSSGVTPIRIFNPDAYCQLCNKEFCNKYFLKTHKANKHGIYIDTQSSTHGSSLPSSTHTDSFIATNINLSPIPTSASVSQNSCISSFTSSKNIEINSSLRFSENISMKSFCAICKKRFCNKYFVRRHKAKIHGIVDDSPTTTPGSSFLSLPDYIQKQEYEEPGSTSAGSDTGSNILEVGIYEPGETREMESDADFYKNEKHSIDKFNANQTSVDISVSNEANILHLKQEIDLEQDGNESGCDIFENSTTTSINKLSPTLSQKALNDAMFSSEQLRRIGVINPDAYCEICRKEYCNKYFLRTHKLKRHGIVIPDGDGKDGRQSEGFSGTWRHIQTSPLNLIIGDHGNNSSDSCEKNKSDASDDIDCDICGSKFQSAYLMHMHRAYLHKGRYEKDVFHINGVDEVTNMQASEKIGPNDLLLSSVPSDSSKAIQANNNEDGASHCATDNITDDLQKLQTMILQLNDLNVSRVTTCSICNKDFPKHDAFHTHMMTDHGIMIEESNEATIGMQQKSDFASSGQTADSISSCILCKKEFLTQFLLKQHTEEFHGFSTSTSTTISLTKDLVKFEIDCRDTTEKTQNALPPTSSDKRVSLTPTSSYCEICNKELCNKYFMKTHMQRMHGIEIENGAQIGGVICDVCNKELCSKYFLKVHKQNTHGISDEGSIPQYSRYVTSGSVVTSSQSDSDHALKPSEMGDLSHRYFTHFTEVCPICNRRFRSTKWLKAHLLNDHGELGVDKWKEIETTYQLQGNQTKLSNHSKTLPSMQDNYSVPDIHNSPTLKIPINWSSHDRNSQYLLTQRESSAEQTSEVESQNALSSLFNSVESSVKSYHCSYCSFSTPLLAFLFVHEKSHTGLVSQVLPDPTKLFQCPVCPQTFNKPDLFQHHILTHQFSGLLNPFFDTSSISYPASFEKLKNSENNILQHSSENIEESDNTKDQRTESDLTITQENLGSSSSGRSKFRCSKCFQRFKSRESCAAHVSSKHGINGASVSSTSPSSDTASVMVAPSKLYKCNQCKFSSIHMVILKKHIRKEHKAEISHHEIQLEGDSERCIENNSVIEEVKKKLEDAVKKSKIPASYAVPQTQPPSVEGFVMQPFLLEEPDRKFVPSLVFLPVREKMSEPLTVSFMLTPA